MKTEQLKEYAQLKIQEKAIAARIKELSPLILADALEAGVDKVPTSLGNFNIKKRKVWTYSEAVTILKERLDATKDKEEADGTAVFTEVEQLEFREIKQ